MTLRLSLLITAEAPGVAKVLGDVKSGAEALSTEAAVAGKGLDALTAGLDGAAAKAGSTDQAITAVRGEVKELATEAKASGAALNNMAAGFEKTVAAAKQASAAIAAIPPVPPMPPITAQVPAPGVTRDYQAIINRTTGVDQPVVSMNRAADMEAFGKALDLQDKYNPLIKLEREHLAVLAEINEAEKVGALQGDAVTAAVQRQQSAYAGQVNALGGVGNTAKLTSNQMLNLSRQGNDVVTMFALGAPPMQIFASQAGQVYDALESGPKGLTGSLQAVGEGIRYVFGQGLANAARAAVGFITPVGLIATGLTAAAAAAVYFGDNTERNVKRAEEAAKSYNETLKRIRSTQGDISASAASIFNEKRLQSGASAAAQIQLEVMRQEAAKKGLAENLISAPVTFGSAMNPFADVTELYRQVTGGTSKGGLAELGAQLEAGKAKASEVEEILLKLRVSPNLPSDLRELVDAMIKTATEAADIEARIDGINGAAARLRLDTTRGNARSAAGSLRELVPPERLTDREEVERRYQQSMASARLLPEARGAMATADADRQKALDEIARKESEIRAGHQLDLQQLTARSAGEKALIAVERERLALSDMKDGPEKQARLDMARDLALADANAAANESSRSRLLSMQDTISSLSMEMAATGKTAGEVTRLTTEYDLMAEAKRAAYAEGRDKVSDAEVEAIKATAAAVGAATTQLSAMRLEQDLLFERSQLYRTDIEADIASTLRSAGIDPTSENGKLNAELMRGNDILAKRKELYRDSVSGLSAELRGVSSLGDLGDVVMKRLQSVFDKQADQIFENAADSVFEMFNPQTSTDGKIQPIAMPTLAALGTTSANAMWTRSADGVGGAAGAITRLLNPANNNASGGMSGNSVQAQMANYLAGKGLAAHQIAGVLGNAKAESAFNPGADTGDGGKALGLFQWNDRANAMKAFVGPDWKTDIQGQMDFFWQEMKTTEKASFDKLMASTDVRGATRAVAGYERPQGYSAANPEGSHNFSGRLSGAEDAYAQLGTSSQQLATSASAFTADFSQVTSQVNAGIGQIADQFVPGFGGILTKILNGMGEAGGGGGGIGGWLGSLFGGSSGGDAWAGLRTVTAATGGWISGPGTGTSDSIPARLSDGEFVVNAAATAKHLPLLEAMNSGRVKRFASGGRATTSPMPSVASAASIAPSMPNISFKFQNMTSGEVVQDDVKATRDANGDIDIEAILRPMVRDEVTNPGRRTARSLKQMGVKPGIVKR